MHFIDEKYINSLINDDLLLDEERQKEIIKKASEGKGLNLKDAAALLNITNFDLYQQLFQTAQEVKEKVYGNRIVLFAPLYLSNVCTNNCKFCEFRIDNKELDKKNLNIDEVLAEAEILIREGHKQLQLITGEHPKRSDIDFIGSIISNIYNLDIEGSRVRKINVNAPPLSLEKFKKLKSFGIGTFHCLQETYHYNTYAEMHPIETENNYAWRLFTMDRAIQAGVEDVGLGVLFGLADYRFETLALLKHAYDLDEKYGIGPHTISVPRLEQSKIAPAIINPALAVDDLSFMKVVAVIRLALPYSGITLSSRERTELRRELIEIGVTQISNGSRTEQFLTDKAPSLDEVVKDCTSLGFIPSFCTACYRSHRTGDKFTELAKAGNIKNFCIPNAFSSFTEYIKDYASEDTKNSSKTFVEEELNKLNKTAKKKSTEMIDKVNNGEKDKFI